MWLVKPELANSSQNLNCNIYVVDIKMNLYHESRDNMAAVLATGAIKRI